MYGLAESLKTPVIAAPQMGDAVMEGEYQQSRPSDLAFYNEPDMRAQPVSGIADLARMLTGGREQPIPPSGRLAQALTQDSNTQKFDEESFQKGVKDTEWYRSFVKRYGEEPNLNAPEYDYRKAWSNGVRPQPDPYDGNMPHWPSALPSGEMLKSSDHPTAWKEYFMRQYGVNPDSLPVEQMKKMIEGMK